MARSVARSVFLQPFGLPPRNRGILLLSPSAPVPMAGLYPLRWSCILWERFLGSEGIGQMVRVGDIGRGLLALALLGALGCGSPGPRPPAPSPQAPSPPAASPSPSPSASPSPSPVAPKRVLERSTLRSRGQNPWKLEADRVEYDETGKTARVAALTWTLMDAQGKTLVRVEGKGARVDLEGKKVSFVGPVVARGARGEVLNVENLVWDETARHFLGTQGVRLVRQGTILTGKRMIASPDLGRLEVEGDVRVTVPEESLGKEKRR